MSIKINIIFLMIKFLFTLNKSKKLIWRGKKGERSKDSSLLNNIYSIHFIFITFFINISNITSWIFSSSKIKSSCSLSIESLSDYK